LDQISFGSVAGDGRGQTIAIIDAYNDPTINADLHGFDAAFGLADPVLAVVAQDGSQNLPGVDPIGPGGANFEGETALDVEWAHALAPGAAILLVEARDATPTNLFAAVNFARQQPGVSVVSMSFGGDESFSETSFDPFFTTPANHGGVTFVASTGDSGVPAGYPAYSPNVLATGGTSLSVNSLGGYQSEIGWSGSGGGISQVESKPSYQNSVSTGSNSFRTTPDVAFDADPRTGVSVYDSYNYGTTTPWVVLGGTSLAAPSWAGILAVVNQGRRLAGKDTLDSRRDTFPLLYTAPASDFHDVTSGNNGDSATSGYDLVTGRGSPDANLLVPFLVNGTIPAPPTNSGPTIASLLASASNVVEGNTVTLTATGVSDPGASGLAVTFYEETNGVAGLQTGANGDFAFSPVTDGSNAIDLDTSNVTGTFTFYAQLTDSSGRASASGTAAPSVSVTVAAPTNTGPTIAGISATPNPIVSGDQLTVTATGLADPQSNIRRVTFYEETNGTPGLQT
jgi:subtilase family serine protease